MAPDLRPVAVLRSALDAALVFLHPSAVLENLPANRLTQYRHELAFGSDAGDPGALGAADQPNVLRAEGWVATTPDEGQGRRTRRHYLVAEVDLHASPPWFPAMLAMSAKLRSHLSPDEQADVTMLLVAQPGPPATGRIAVLERNEAFARVLVWSPSPTADEWPSEAKLFVGRLGLGPMGGVSGETAADLSPVDAVFEGTNVSTETRAKWRDILMNTTFREVDRAQSLLATVDTPQGGTDGE